jgi:HEAT repeat protein
MKKPLTRVTVGVLIGLLMLTGAIWVVGKTLGDHDRIYEGKSLDDWKQQLESHDVGASNQAYETVSKQIVPQLVDQMFHDTNDSQLRMTVVETIKGLPGMWVDFTDAFGRRCGAALNLGGLGPTAKAAVPSLIAVLQGPEVGMHETVIQALGNIHSNPEIVIPLLIPYLTNDDMNDEVATALGKYGSQAKAAFPKIVPLLTAKDKDARKAAQFALKNIDPEAAAKVGVK